MNIRRRNRPGLVVMAALVFACLVTLVSGVTAVNVATGSFQIGSVGETASIPIVLDSASGGLSGYRITVSLSNPSVATITAVAFPEWASLKSSSGLPAGQVLLSAVDLSSQVPVGGTGVVLATLTVKGTAVGSTSITITPDPNMGIEDRSGNLYAVVASPGTVTVGTPSSGVVPTVNPTANPTAVVPPYVTPTAGTVTAVPTVIFPTVITTGVVPTVSPPPGIPTSPPSVIPIGTVVPIATSVPGVISTGGSTVITNPTVISPGIRTTFVAGKRYAIGNPGSFIGTRFGSGGTAANTTAGRTVTGAETTLKPGSRAYGINPPTSRFVRWYPEARWKAGIK